MDLKIFFSPINEEVYNDITDHTSFFKSIQFFGEKQPDYKGANLAIIGLCDSHNDPEGNAKAADEIRKKLYRLKKGFGQYRIVDLGNLRKGIDVSESHMRLKEVCSILIENDVLPVVIGGSHDYTYAQYLSYESLDKLVSLLNVDAFLDLEDDPDDNEINNRNHLHKILLHEPNFLFSISQLAYQSYLIDNDTMVVLEKLYFDTYRLGHLRQYLPEMEPIIRDADLMSFDITSIKSSDAPGSNNAQPFGLTGEEACQICWYAGINEKLSSVGFYEYNPDADDKHMKTASVVATMVWYFIEGFYHRKDECNFRGNDYLRFVVSMPAEPAMLVFYKSKLSEKWWMEVPYPQNYFQYERNLIIPCSYSDYQAATEGDVPERWISTQAKLI